MGMTNDELIRKADLAQDALQTDGGEMVPDKFDQFLGRAVEKSELLEMANTTSQSSVEAIFPKMKFTGQVVHRVPTHGTALSQANRSAPTMSEVSIRTEKFMAEVSLNFEHLEDNIMQERLEGYLVDYMGQYVGRDTQRIALNGDTTSADIDYNGFDGLRALVTSNTVDALSAALDIDKLEEALSALPEEFLGEMDKLRFMMAHKEYRKYRKALSSRIGALGDALLTNQNELTQLSVDLASMSSWPTNLGVGSDETDVLLTDPENFRISFWRNVRMAREVDERAQKVHFIWSYRFGVALEEEEACVKIENVQVA